MNRKLAAFLTISLACTLVGQARGQEKAPLSDLTLSNFFSEGWDQPWSKRARGDGTPDMSLLRVQTNFLVQLLRIDTFLETGMTAPNSSQSEFVNGTVEYALNRRFMPAIFFSHQWIEGASGSADRDGSAGGLFTRFQLVDRQHDSMAFNLKMALPNTDIGEHATIWSYALAGWGDLQTLELGRTGLYWHLQHEIAGEPVKQGTVRNDLNYALSLPHTWTSPHDRLENLTTFIEAAGKTYLDGDHSGRTIFVGSLQPQALELVSIFELLSLFSATQLRNLG